MSPQIPKLIGIFLLLAAALSCGADETNPVPAAATFVRLTLVPERPAAKDEALWLEVFIGALPAGASLAIADGEGNPLGAIAPYGKSVREAGGSHLVPLPEALQQAQKIELRIELQLDGKKSVPTAEQLRKVELVYVPVAR